MVTHAILILPRTLWIYTYIRLSLGKPTQKIFGNYQERTKIRRYGKGPSSGPLQTGTISRRTQSLRLAWKHLRLGCVRLVLPRLRQAHSLHPTARVLPCTGRGGAYALVLRTRAAALP